MFHLFSVNQKLFEKKLDINTSPSNIDAVNGKTGIALLDFDEHMNGKVKIDGETWSAHSNVTLVANDKIKVIKADGVILQVTKLLN